MPTIDDYIEVLAESSKTVQHELIEECLRTNGVLGVRDLTEEQAKAFCQEKGISVSERNSNRN